MYTSVMIIPLPKKFVLVFLIFLDDVSMLIRNLFYRMESTPFKDFHIGLDKSLGKLGSQPKQIIKF